jgi:hypothetical protein
MRTAPLFLLLFAGCVSIPLPRGGEPVSEAQRPELARKMVAGKRAPNHLIATDESTCATTEARFERTQPGDRVWCAWRDGGRASTAGRRRITPGSLAAVVRSPRLRP